MTVRELLCRVADYKQKMIIRDDTSFRTLFDGVVEDFDLDSWTATRKVKRLAAEDGTLMIRT